ncbi:MAG: DUF45 domain-containing protein [Alphaproteobacteria bacterium]|nr:DUF45 domain-containing protein [Alphaproteobacteria bacterium]
MTPPSGTERLSLAVAGLDAPVAVRRSARARRLSLRVDPRTGGATLVAPPQVPAEDLRRFVSRHRDWLTERLAAVPGRLPFADGAVIPFLGEPHCIRHVPQQERPVLRQDGELRVSGRSDHLARRVADFLKAEAARRLSALAHDKAARLGLRPARIAVRDTRSRWGSCSGTGRLNFSWRLILAPEPVVDYVVAHEVAHLKEMNHSPRFWRLVAQLTPAMEEGRAWLRSHGAALHRYGPGRGDGHAG